jgi:hypothetical protein
MVVGANSTDWTYFSPEFEQQHIAQFLKTFFFKARF